MEILSDIFQYMALGLGLYSLTQKNDQKLIYYSIIVNFLLIPHLLLIGSWSSAMVVTFIMFRIMAAYKFNNNYTYSFFILAGFAHLGLLIYQNIVWYEYLPVLAGILVTHTYFKLKKIPMRVTFIIGSILWVIAGVSMGSHSIAILNGLGCFIHITTIIRIHRDDKKQKLIY